MPRGARERRGSGPRCRRQCWRPAGKLTAAAASGGGVAPAPIIEPLLRLRLPRVGQMNQIFVGRAQFDIVHLAKRAPWHPFAEFMPARILASVRKVAMKYSRGPIRDEAKNPARSAPIDPERRPSTAGRAGIPGGPDRTACIRHTRPSRPWGKARGWCSSTPAAGRKLAAAKQKEADQIELVRRFGRRCPGRRPAYRM